MESTIRCALVEERDYLDLDDEEEILRAATEIRQRRIAERGRLEAEGKRRLGRSSTASGPGLSPTTRRSSSATS